MSDPLTLEQDARVAWQMFADPYRSAYVQCHVIVYDSGDTGLADTYAPAGGEYIQDVLARIDPKRHDRMVLIAPLVGNYEGPPGMPTDRPPQEFKVVIAVDKEGHSFALSQADGMPEPWAGETGGPIFADMVATLHRNPGDLDAELRDLLGSDDDVA